MPYVMKLDQTDVLCLADPAEGPYEVPRFDRPPCPGGENEICVRPRRPHFGPVPRLSDALGRQRLPGQLEQRQVPLTSPSLDRPDVHLTAYPLDLLFDADRSGGEIDVLPAEPEDFATAQAIEDEQHERRMKRVRLRDGKELPRLFCGPRPDGPGGGVQDR